MINVILFPQHPVSLMHKNPQRRKIIHEMRPVERKERSIDLKMIFWCNILVRGISVSGLIAAYIKAQAFSI